MAEHIGLSRDRVAEIYVPIDGSVGSGYFVTPRIVLTAKHVVRSAMLIDHPLPAPKDSDQQDYVSELAGTRPRCQVRLLRDEPYGDFVHAIVVWWSTVADVALVAFDSSRSEPAPLSPLVWADLSDSEPFAVTAVGFPAADVEGRVRESRQLSGHLNPLSGVKAGRWVVSVEEKIGAVRGGEKSPWAGLSGAALFADNYLIGVMIGDADPAELNRLELWALPARMFADDPDFVRWVRWDSGDGAWTKSDKSPPSQISLLRRIAATTTPAPILIDPEHLHEHRRAKEIHFNNMLLPDFSIHEESESGEIRPSVAPLPFLIDELISRGVLDVHIFDGTRYDSAVDELPVVLQGRVVLSKNKRKYTDLAAKIFEPLFNELNLANTWFEHGYLSLSRDLSENERRALGAGLFIMAEIPKFLYALENRLMCHFDLTSVIEALNVLRAAAQSQEMRANSSILLGFFRSYNLVSHDSIVIAATEPHEIIERFEKFTRDLYYQDLSRKLHGLGLIGVPLADTIVRINRTAARLREAVRLEGGTLGRRSIAVAGEVPKNDLGLTVNLREAEYLPPLSNLRGVVELAIQNLFRSRPDKKFYRSDDSGKPWEIREVNFD